MAMATTIPLIHIHTQVSRFLTIVEFRLDRLISMDMKDFLFFLLFNVLCPPSFHGPCWLWCDQSIQIKKNRWISVRRRSGTGQEYKGSTIAVNRHKQRKKKRRKWAGKTLFSMVHYSAMGVLWYITWMKFMDWANVTWKSVTTEGNEDVRIRICDREKERERESSSIRIRQSMLQWWRRPVIQVNQWKEEKNHAS